MNISRRRPNVSKLGWNRAIHSANYFRLRMFENLHIGPTFDCGGGELAEFNLFELNLIVIIIIIIIIIIIVIIIQGSIW